LTINLFNILPIFLGPKAFLIGVEKPNPGNDGTITSNPSSIFPPNFSGCASFGIISKNSITLPGHPCKSNNGLDLGFLLFSFIKCRFIPSTLVL